jgi:hypothetical protein
VPESCWIRYGAEGLGVPLFWVGAIKNHTSPRNYALPRRCLEGTSYDLRRLSSSPYGRRASVNSLAARLLPRSPNLIEIGVSVVHALGATSTVRVLQLPVSIYLEIGFIDGRPAEGGYSIGYIVWTTA